MRVLGNALLSAVVIYLLFHSLQRIFLQCMSGKIAAMCLAPALPIPLWLRLNVVSLLQLERGLLILAATSVILQLVRFNSIMFESLIASAIIAAPLFPMSTPIIVR